MAVTGDLLITLQHVAQALESLGIDWAVGGSVASSAHGEPRATNDIDIVATVRLSHVSLLAAAWRDRFYCDEAVMRDAVKRSSSFNLIDETTFVKVDVFVPAAGPLGDGQLTRRQRYDVPGSSAIYLLSPEDVLLQKLRWFELGNRVSERQWRDIVSLLRISGAELDMEYVTRVAAWARLEELLAAATSDSRE